MKYRRDRSSGLLLPELELERGRLVEPRQRLCSAGVHHAWPMPAGATNANAAAIYPDLVAWWTFDENDATTQWLDHHSTHHMTLLASRTTSQDGSVSPTIAGRSVFVNTSSNTGGYVPRADTAFDKADDPFTFWFWWRTSAVGVDDLTRFIAGRWGGTGAGQTSYIVQGRTLNSPASQGFIFAVRNSTDSGNTSIIHTGGVPIAANTWYFVVFCHDPVNDLLIGYVNGTKQSTAFSGGVYASSSANFSFGNGYRSDTTYYDNTRDYTSYLDEFGFMNRVITDAEEAYLRNSGAGKSYATFKTEAGH